MAENDSRHTKPRSSGEIGNTSSTAPNAEDLELSVIDNRNPSELGEKLLASRQTNKTWKLSRLHERMIQRGTW